MVRPKKQESPKIGPGVMGYSLADSLPKNLSETTVRKYIENTPPEQVWAGLEKFLLVSELPEEQKREIVHLLFRSAKESSYPLLRSSFERIDAYLSETKATPMYRTLVEYAIRHGFVKKDQDDLTTRTRIEPYKAQMVRDMNAIVAEYAKL